MAVGAAAAAEGAVEVVAMEEAAAAAAAVQAAATAAVLAGVPMEGEWDTAVPTLQEWDTALARVKQLGMAVPTLRSSPRRWQGCSPRRRLWIRPREPWESDTKLPFAKYFAQRRNS